MADVKDPKLTSPDPPTIVAPPEPPVTPDGHPPSVAPAPDGHAAPAPPTGALGRMEDQFALRQLISEYLIPVETNTLWYTLGGVLAIALVLEVLTGVLLSFVYAPDAGRAYGITRDLLSRPVWSVILNFHYWNAFVIFALVLLHMLRVFVTGGYRGLGQSSNQGLWLTGIVLAFSTFIASVTGESLHWDEVGFAVPWHVSEVFQAIGLASAVHYTFADLKNVTSATAKLGQIYAVHISMAPLLLFGFLVLHYYLIKVKVISFPFWRKASGKVAPFSSHIREWLIYGGIILGLVLLVAIFVPRDPGTAPQLLPDSPLYGSTHGPGGLGYKPTFPISWTHGMNVFVGEHLGIEPDIWGSILGMTVMVLALLAIPFVDRGRRELHGWRQAFNLRERGWAFLAMGLFWLILIIGVVQNFVAGAG
ncbi:MAG: cytochrome b N-terminal domain-containing protein [Thermomicrobiales bacterium]